jgi:hypothetical protein
VGAEIACNWRVGGKTVAGTALLETDYVLLRGAVRRRLSFSEIRGVEAKGGTLALTLSDGKVELSLGAAAAKWAEKIARPKGIVEKLGVRPGAKVALVGAFPASFVGELEAAGPRVTVGARGTGHDQILFAAPDVGSLAKIGALRARIAPNGGVWVVYPKGRKELREADVLAAGRAAGLKDVKVARFSETHTALRFVIPVGERGA